MNHIWSKIKEHYGFQTTGSRFIDLTQTRIQSDEKPEDLYKRLFSFFDDNLVTIEGGLLHHGSVVDVDEDITPSIENVIVLLWLERINPGLPGLVKQRYGIELPGGYSLPFYTGGVRVNIWGLRYCDKMVFGVCELQLRKDSIFGA